MPSEFELIARYFTRPTQHTRLGVGDDGALVSPTPAMELVVSTDMLVAGTHFLPDADAEAVGWKSLAVNVSDLAAMGAQPRWALLAAALPDADELWIAAFAEGFFACAQTFGIDVIGGDTTRGPMNFCVTIFGEVPPGQALLRSGARPGDEIWVSGTPGRAALGLAHLQGRCQLGEAALADCLTALARPQPRLALGLGLRGLASAAIDVSDGLLADLGHILGSSKVSAALQFERLPDTAWRYCPDQALAQDCLLAGGDDYELVFTAPVGAHARVATLAQSLGLALTCIGQIADGAPGKLVLLDREQKPIAAHHHGFDHFA
ncbi:MAG: thiamine-phosphate kinase [Sterolibacterium sp.]|nr:thiamine-phosphate kinase [Sterolibacterium sp.]